MKKSKLFAVLALVVAVPAWGVIGGGDVTMKNKGGDVVFSHAAHVEGANLNCQSCHPKLFLDKKHDKPVTMKQMAKGKSCGFCHNGKKAFSVSANCENCHKK